MLPKPKQYSSLERTTRIGANSIDKISNLVAKQLAADVRAINLDDGIYKVGNEAESTLDSLAVYLLLGLVILLVLYMLSYASERYKHNNKPDKSTTKTPTQKNPPSVY